MIRLDAGNVLLKPSHRRQLMSWLKRALKLGQKLGDFALTITMQRTGRLYVLHARVHDTAGDFACKCRRNDWHDAARDLVRLLVQGLTGQRLQQRLA